jgi:hypothetical protein
VIGAKDHLQVFWVEPGRECRGAHKVAEHDRELATPRAVVQGGLGSCGWRRRARRSVGKLANGAQQLLTVPEREADFLQVLVGQIAENAGIDVIFGKTLRILPEANCVEPVRNRLHCGPQLWITDYIPFLAGMCPVAGLPVDASLRASRFNPDLRTPRGSGQQIDRCSGSSVAEVRT